ncbi:ATP-binding cassette domain-containing protein [Candidatus Uhrbacteria bacterium]|nr:ATP-binding cassette domain-containing protein [Candidatus Uhrbacteria bacterium]
MKPLLEAVNLCKTYGRQTVLDGLSFVLSEGTHGALIGRNGSGKTTLLHILAGDEEADSGTFRLMPWTRLGVLRQHEILPDEGTTIGYLSGNSGKPEWKCAKLAARFGIRPAELGRAPAALSGGYQMRVKIVRMLLDQPNLLLLDEPVNYLDLPTLLLLEAFLRDYPGAFVMTSHDREVLQNVCTSTWEIAAGKLVTFPSDVETYLDWKEEQAEYTRRTNRRVRREMADAQAFADRFRAKASLATRAQSKLRHIAKLRTQLRELGGALPTAAFRIPCPPFTAGTAVRVEGLAVGYGSAVVAKDIALEVPRGAKVGIVGENGRGKSTLLKTLGGTLAPLDGTLKWWHRADIGFFSQHAEDTLSPQETVLQALTRAAPPDAPAERILSAAGAFLFREDDLEKTCGVLSGGERARVRLARLVLQEHNVLLLDEPTNHLDAETVEALAVALKAYPGTVFIVSHARTFMNAIVDRLYEVRNGTLRHCLGTYEEYVFDLANLAEEASHATEGSSAGVSSVSADGRAERRELSLLARERRRSQQRLEEKIKKLDREKSEILSYFFENPTDYAPEKSRRLSEIEEEMALFEKEWLDLEAKAVV